VQGEVRDIEYVECGSSTEIADALILAVMKHAPVWLVGYNCYNFDNQALFAHTTMKHIFRNLTTPRSSASLALCIPGVINGDLYVYLNKTQRSSYSSLSLNAVCLKVLGEGKAPEVDVVEGCDEMTVMKAIMYNAKDSHLVMLAWKMTGTEDQVVALCELNCCDPLDACRYVTGVMMSCMVANRLLRRNMRMDWSPCKYVAYKGGELIFDTPGVWRNIAVLDYKSMYPSIVIAGNISPETIIVLPSDGAWDWARWANGQLVCSPVHGVVCTFLPDQGEIPRIMEEMIGERAKIPKSNPKNLALKVGANSLYGAMGYEQSPLYSPLAAACVTCAGRNLLRMAKHLCTRLGLQVVYGDTDSLMYVVNDSATRSNLLPQNVAYIVNVILARLTGHAEIKLEASCSEYNTTAAECKCMVLFTKKRYVMRMCDETFVFKGVAVVRKDHTGLEKSVSRALYDVLTAKGTPETRLIEIAAIISHATYVISRGTMPLYLAGKETQLRGGDTQMEYWSPRGRVFQSMKLADPNALVRISRGHMFRSMLSACREISLLLGYSSVPALMESAMKHCTRD